ncbi:hypothetical protein [Sphingobacterium sp.]|nr:hypothetical protein [Sphingobacterium sp.]
MKESIGAQYFNQHYLHWRTVPVPSVQHVRTCLGRKPYRFFTVRPES